MQLTFLVVCCLVWSTMWFTAKGQRCLLLKDCGHLRKMHGLEHFIVHLEQKCKGKQRKAEEVIYFGLLLLV